MIKHLAPHGNSAALIIDKPIMELMDITIKTPLKITTDGTSLIISPCRTSAREKKFQEALAWVHSKHEKTFRRLAR